MTRPAKCTVYQKPCAEHDFVHGAEAEELREGIEKVAAGLREASDDESSADVQREIARALQVLLDRVDARDSLAFLEAQDSEDS